MSRACRSLAGVLGLAASLLGGAPGLAVEAQRPAVEAVVGRGATDNLGCDAPGAGNQCFVVTCGNCTGDIVDEGFLVRSLEITEEEIAEQGFESCTVERVKLAIELTHSFLGDVIVRLDHDGTEVTVYAPPEDCTEENVDAVFSDAAAKAPNPCPALAGPYRPDEPLSGLASSPLAGDWTLSIEDTFEADIGTLDRVAFAFDATCSEIGEPPPPPQPPPPQPPPPPPPPPPPSPPPPAVSGCISGPQVLCLGEADRFKVEVAWKTPEGATGNGNAVELTSDTGYLWFFNQENVELVVKVLNGCGISQHYWVFAGGLTDVEVLMVVTDTLRGAQRIYFNPQHTAFLPLQDTRAFDTCP